MFNLLTDAETEHEYGSLLEELIGAKTLIHTCTLDWF